MFKFLLYCILLSLCSVTVLAQSGSVDGIVWNDLNNNHTKDAGEPSLQNWKVKLSGPRNDSMLTDGGGHYVFSNLPNGQATLSLTPQSGWLQTFPQVGDQHVNVNGNQIHNVNFGVYQQPVMNASISGILFNDTDSNGIEGINETGLSGWNVLLGGKKIDSVLTNANGEYSFSGLDSGNYTLQIVTPGGWQITAPPSFSYSFHLNSGEALTEYYFGLRQETGPNLTSISGIKYKDDNTNGTRDAGERVVSGWKIYLSGAASETLATNSEGKYAFGDLSAGLYTVSEESRDGWTQRQPASGSYHIFLHSGESSTGNDFGNSYFPTIIPSITINDSTIVEGDSGTRHLVFTLSLSFASIDTVTVHYATRPGTATADDDFGSDVGRVVFPPSVTTETLPISIYGDTIPEANEKFSILLTDPFNANIADDTGKGTIINDDGSSGGSDIPHPGDDNYCVCTPLTGNYPPSEEQLWFVRAVGGPMNIRLIAQAVNPTDPESVFVKVIDDAGSIIATGGVGYTAAEAAAGGVNFEKVYNIPVSGLSTGELVRVIVTDPPPTPITQTHYRLQICGAISAGISTPTFSGFEEEPALWYIRVGPLSDVLALNFFTDGVPDPATSFTYSVFNQDNIYKGTYTATIGTGWEVLIPLTFVDAGTWAIRIDSINGHYRIDNGVGYDSFIYAGWNSAAHSTKRVVIEHNDSLAFGKSYVVDGYEYRKLSATTDEYHKFSSVTTDTAGYNFKELFPGYYKFAVTPVDSMHITTPDAQLDTLACSQKKVNLFATRDTSKSETEYDTLYVWRNSYTPFIFHAVGCITSEPAGIACDSFNLFDKNDTVFAVYAKGTRVKLTAIAPTHYEFSGWTVPWSTYGFSSDTLNVTMDSTIRIEALFQGQIEIAEVIVNDTSMGYVSGNAVPCHNIDCSYSYAYGAPLDLRAIARPGYKFVGWGGDESGTDTLLSIIMDTNRTITATFEPVVEYDTLYVWRNSYTPSSLHAVGCISSEPAGISCDSFKVFQKSDTAFAIYAKGTKVKLTETVPPHYKFGGWWNWGDVVPHSYHDTITITMDSTMRIEALFEGQTETLKVSVNDTSMGRVVNDLAGTAGDGTFIDCGSDCNNTFGYGYSMKLTAQAKAGYSFLSWGGDASGTDTSIMFDMDTNKTITAMFRVAPVYETLYVWRQSRTYDIIATGCVTSNPPGISCDMFNELSKSDTVFGVFERGTTVELYPSATTHYEFSTWSKWDSSFTVGYDTISVTMDSTIKLIALFLGQQESLKVTSNDTTMTYGIIIYGDGTSRDELHDGVTYIWYRYGRPTSIYANPRPGYEFVKWGGDLSSTSDTVNFILDTNYTITATFKASTYTARGRVDYGSATSTTAFKNKSINVNSSDATILAIGSLRGDSLLTHPDAGQRFSLDLWIGQDYTLSVIPPDGWGIGSAQGCTYQLSYTGEDTVELAPCSLYLDSLQYRTATYQQWATATNSKGKQEPEKRIPTNGEFGYRVPTDTLCANGLHIEFTIPVLRGITSDTLGIAESVDAKKKKWNITFDHPMCGVSSPVTITGMMAEGKYQKVSTYWWTLNGKIVGKKKKNVTVTKNTLGLPMPNLNNVGSELFPKGFGQSGSLFDNGLVVGIPQGNKKANSVIHKTYADVLKSFSKKVKNGLLFHDDQVRCLDSLDNGKPISAQQKTLAPDKQNNKLFAEALTLKLNVAASIGNKFPNGFGELTFSDPSDAGNPFNGMMVEHILALSDSVLSCLATPYTENEMYELLTMLNSSFSDSTIDTLSFASKTMLTGVKHLGEVPYLHLTPGITPKSVNLEYTADESVPQRMKLFQNYPNPFNPTTMIQFTITDPSLVTLQVYDVLGREIATLLERQGYDAGEYSVPFNATSSYSGFASGVYYYRITVETVDEDGIHQTFSDVKRMMMIK